MSIRKFAVASLAALAAVCVAAKADAQVKADAVLQTAVAAEFGQDGIGAAVLTQKTQAAVDKAAFVQAEFHGERQRGGERGGDRGGDRGRPDRRPEPRPFPGPVDHGDHGDHRGHGGWDRWPGHPGWGGDRWALRDGRWLWWGWAPWVAGGAVACNYYYANSYQACSNAAWASDTACEQSCAYTGDPNCSAQCTYETREAINSCQWSYDQAWNCGYPAVWPPVGVIIRIP